MVTGSEEKGGVCEGKRQRSGENGGGGLLGNSVQKAGYNGKGMRRWLSPEADSPQTSSPEKAGAAHVWSTSAAAGRPLH